MKKSIIKSFNSNVLFGGLLLLSISSCEKLKDFKQINVNPLGALTPVTAALISNVESGLGETVVGISTQGGIAAGLYCQYFSLTQYPDVGLYSEPKYDCTSTYASGYVVGNSAVGQGSMMDCQVVINKNTDPATAGLVVAYGSNANQIAVAKILKTYLAWTITDRWGDVPYSEALLGSAKLYPKYDQQSDIYKQFLTDLTDAVNGFDDGLAVKGDLMYDGDQTKWKKLANTLRMSISLRMSKRFPNAGEYAATEFAAAFGNAAGFIKDNADNFTLEFPGGSYKNTWYNTYLSRSDYGLCKTMLDALVNLADTRQSAFGTNTVGFPYGLTSSQGNTVTGYSKVLANNLRAENSPIVIVNAATGLLAEAEAEERGWITGGSAAAKIAYESAVTQSFAQWGLTVPATYFAGAANYDNGLGAGTIGLNSFNSIPSTSNGATASKLDRIALQRWIALFPDGIQGWSEWRRTGIPNLQPTINAINNPKEIPRRYVYGVAEYNLNGGKVTEAASRISGGDLMGSHVWWDQ